MAERLHLVVREDEKERYRASADRAGLSLSEWVRQAAREKLDRESPGGCLGTVEELKSFFARCDARHAGEGPEPDWEHHKRVIEDSIRCGLPVGGEG